MKFISFCLTFLDLSSSEISVRISKSSLKQATGMHRFHSTTIFRTLMGVPLNKPRRNYITFRECQVYVSNGFVHMKLMCWFFLQDPFYPNACILSITLILSLKIKKTRRLLRYILRNKISFLTTIDRLRMIERLKIIRKIERIVKKI